MIHCVMCTEQQQVSSNILCHQTRAEMLQRIPLISWNRVSLPAQQMKKSQVDINVLSALQLV